MLAFSQTVWLPRSIHWNKCYSTLWMGN